MCIDSKPKTKPIPDHNLNCTAGTSQTITLSGGAALKLMASPDGDSIKMVGGTDACETGIATKDATPGEILDLLGVAGDSSNEPFSNEKDGATMAAASVTFSATGSYKVCYKAAGAGEYGQVGSTLLTVAPANAAPTAFNPLYLSTGSSQTFTVTGGSGLNLEPNSDAAAVVESKNACTAASGSGSLEAKDLGPNDDGGATEATAVVTVQRAGTYKVCYKLGGTYGRVGDKLLTFSATAPASFTPTKWTLGKLGWF